MKSLRLVFLCFVFSFSSVYGAFEFSSQGGLMAIEEKSDDISEPGPREFGYILKGAGHFTFDLTEKLIFGIGGFYQHSNYSQTVDISGVSATNATFTRFGLDLKLYLKSETEYTPYFRLNTGPGRITVDVTSSVVNFTAETTGIISNLGGGVVFNYGSSISFFLEVGSLFGVVETEITNVSVLTLALPKLGGSLVGAQFSAGLIFSL